MIAANADATGEDFLVHRNSERSHSRHCHDQPPHRQASDASIVVPRLLDELSFHAEYTLQSKVWFGNVEVLQFSYTLGDNPSVSHGCPIAMSADVVAQQQHRIVDYERMRLPNRRKSRKELRMPAEERTRILNHDVGIPVEQILQRAAAVHKEKERRQKTSRSQRCELLHEKLLANHELLKAFQQPIATTGDGNLVKTRGGIAHVAVDQQVHRRKILPPCRVQNSWGSRLFGKMML
mmetsp:Transcript_16027/g.44931  ORF Transcript_16027/g.44931 Transcript_16027/m.44931 type:complete len:236 (+) Transcript_16027:109-816(+)